MLKYVENPNLISIINLPSKNEIRDIYESTNTMSDEKISKIISCYGFKIESVMRMQNHKSNYYLKNNTTLSTSLKELINISPEIKIGNKHNSINNKQTFNNEEQPDSYDYK